MLICQVTRTLRWKLESAPNVAVQAVPGIGTVEQCSIFAMALCLSCIFEKCAVYSRWLYACLGKRKSLQYIPNAVMPVLEREKVCSIFPMAFCLSWKEKKFAHRIPDHCKALLIARPQQLTRHQFWPPRQGGFENKQRPPLGIIS